MIKLLLALLLLAGELGAACASGTLRYYPMPGGTNVTENCFGDSLTLNGTIAAAAQACGLSSTMAGPFGSVNTNYYSTDSDLWSAFEVLAGYSIEFYVYFSAAPNIDTLFRINGTPTATEASVSSISADPATVQFRQFNGGWSGVNTGAILSVGVCYQIAVTHNGTVGKIYVDGVEKGSATFGAAITDVTSFNIGTDLGTGFDNGYLTNFRISSVVRTVFPTLDPVNTVRGMKLRKVLRMKQ